MQASTVVSDVPLSRKTTQICKAHVTIFTNSHFCKQSKDIIFYSLAL